MILNDVYTSTGAKFFAHEEAMRKLRNGKGQPITTHVMLTDVCQHTCAFCSVQARAGDSLTFEVVQEYLRTLLRYDLKSVILSGGGNPILYKCRESGADFNDVVNWIRSMGLEIGLITNGMPMQQLLGTGRLSWKTVIPDTLDKLTWVRISMAGLDHAENEVYVPDIDPSKTTLGFSYVAHDIYEAPEDKHHGKVSTEQDLLSLGVTNVASRNVRRFEDREYDLIEEISKYVHKYQPRYVRLLPNCLEPHLISKRCEQLQEMADTINHLYGKNIVFVQQKPPKAPHACYLGYIHPVLNCDGYVYPCDSCVLNETAGHQFANPWRICRWDEIAQLYEKPVMSLIMDPANTCPGCVFTNSNEILRDVVNGEVDITPPKQFIEHINFV